MSFPRCPCCNNIITNDDCGSSINNEGYTDCCGINIYTGEPENED